MLATARELFTTDALPTMAQVAARAGISRTTLYELFGSRDALMAELGLDRQSASATDLVAAAIELLAEGGLVALSVEEAAARAGMARTTAYRLFPGKDALLKEILLTAFPIDELVAYLDAARDRPPEEVVPSVAHSLGSLGPTQLAVVRVMLLEALHTETAGAETRGTYVRMVEALIAYISAQMDAGRLRRMNPALAIKALFGPVWIYLIVRPTWEDDMFFSDTSVGAAIDELVAGALRAMQPD